MTRSYGRLAQPDRLDPQPGTRGPRGAAAVAEFERGDYPHASVVRRVYGTWGAALATVSATPAQLPYTHRTKRRADWTRGGHHRGRPTLGSRPRR